MFKISGYIFSQAMNDYVRIGGQHPSNDYDEIRERLEKEADAKNYLLMSSFLLFGLTAVQAEKNWLKK